MGRNHIDRGAFVVVVGPDGVGKTTIATALLDRHEGPTAYFHYRPRVFRTLETSPDLGGPVRPKTVDEKGSKALGWLRLARAVAVAWIAHMTRVGPAVRRGTLVVGDRWVYGYVAQPQALKFYGPARMAAWVVRVLPAPDLVLNLIADVEVIRQRKDELSAESISFELAAWASLPVRNLQTFDASLSPAEIAALVEERLRPSYHRR